MALAAKKVLKLVYPQTVFLNTTCSAGWPARGVHFVFLAPPWGSVRPVPLSFFTAHSAMPAKSGKAKEAPKHPSYVEMVKEAVAATGKPVKGASRVSIAKYIGAKYGKVLGSHLKCGLRLALKKAAASGILVQTKGSYRVSKAAKKPKVKKAKKPKAKKVKKPKAKKVKKPKKPSKGKKAARLLS